MNQSVSDVTKLTNNDMDKITIKNSWESLTFAEFEQLIQISDAEIPETYKTAHLISILTGLSVDEVESLPIPIYMKLTPALAFLNTTPPEIKHKNEYTVNGRKYIVHAEVDKICTAQFLDYTGYGKDKPVSTTKMASCFLVPEGHKYGDGYDIAQVWFDIGCMNFLDVKALSFFLQHQYAAYLLISNDYINRMMKKMKVPKKKRQESLRHLNNMARSLLS
jgi:hypothetical protein